MLDASNINEAFQLYDNLLVLFNQFDEEESPDTTLADSKEFKMLVKTKKLLLDLSSNIKVGLVDANDAQNSDMLD